MSERAAASGPSLRPTRENRVRKRAEYLEIQAHGARVNGDCLVFILSRRSDPHGATRLGVTASRRIGGAVQRNRAKRLIKEAFRCVFADLPKALDLVVIVRRPLGERKLSDVVTEWRRALPQIRRKAGS